LYRKLQVDALYTGTDSSRSPSTELEPAPKDSRAFVTERPENSPEIPETPTITLEKVARKEDYHSEDGKYTLLCMWTLVDRD
jgi:hypothetical protein